MVSPLTFNPLAPQSSGATAELAAAGTADAKSPTPRPEMLRAARDFEAIFLRTLLKPMENTTRLSSSGQGMPGQSAYGSMVVGALSDSLSASGGLGLADVIAKAMAASEAASAAATPSSSGATRASSADQPAATAPPVSAPVSALRPK